MGRLEVLVFLCSVIELLYATTYEVTKPAEWWQTTTLYQIWPRSFKDSDGDGIGDLNGITSKLEHLLDMGIEVIWLSPFYPSPMVDSGYDVSEYCDVNPTYGTLEDFDNLVAKAKNLGLKVMLDYVPNHTSDQHEWFMKSKAGIAPYTDYYIWNEGKLDANGTRQPPNNWLSVFNSGSAWEWVEERQAYYFHQFHQTQVDLDLTNPLVMQETKDILTFWMDRGVDGFRIDALTNLVEAASLADEPLSGLDGYTSKDYYSLDHIYTKDQPGNYEMVQIWKDHVEEYTREKGDNVVRIIATEAYANITNVQKYYDFGSDVPFNFFFIKDKDGVYLVNLQTAKEVVDVINLWMSNMPSGATANWVVGNHDNSRVATRYGSERVDGLLFIMLLLPGIATIYNGDELGMIDTHITWDQTEDPQACNTDETRYAFFSRDPERTPYQWDNSTSAGFSTNSTTVLPVNENYLTLNLAAQMEAEVSHYKNVQAIMKLRKSTVIRQGSLNVQVIGDDVVAVSREFDSKPQIMALINWINTTDVTISLEVFENVPDLLEVVIADINSGISVGDVFDKTSVELPANAAVVLQPAVWFAAQ